MVVESNGEILKNKTTEFWDAFPKKSYTQEMVMVRHFSNLRWNENVHITFSHNQFVNRPV